MLYLDEGALIQGTLLVLPNLLRPNLLRPNLLRPRIQVQFTTGAGDCIGGIFSNHAAKQKESRGSWALDSLKHGYCAASMKLPGY